MFHKISSKYLIQKPLCYCIKQIKSLEGKMHPDFARKHLSLCHGFTDYVFLCNISAIGPSIQA